MAKRGSLTLGPGRKAYGPQLSFSSMRASASPIAGGVERQHRLMEQVVLQMLRSQLFEVAAGRYTFESYGAPQDVGHMERQWEGSRNMLGQPENAEAHALTCYRLAASSSARLHSRLAPLDLLFFCSTAPQTQPGENTSRQAAVAEK